MDCRLVPTGPFNLGRSEPYELGEGLPATLLLLWHKKTLFPPRVDLPEYRPLARLLVKSMPGFGGGRGSAVYSTCPQPSKSAQGNL